MQQLARHSDDGIAPGEAVECFTPNAAAEALSRKDGHVGAVAFSPAQATLQRAISATLL